MQYYLDTNTLIFLIDSDKDHLIISQAISDRIDLISSDTKFKEYISQGLKFIYNKR